VHLDPTDANIHALIARKPAGPISMLNLLRFREVADYALSPELAPTAPISGSAAYALYVEHTVPFLEASGGSYDVLGDGGAWFVGPEEERWDHAILVHQRSLEDFFAFATDTAYIMGLGHRTAALEDSRILPLVRTP
jgi:hypothetical protein